MSGQTANSEAGTLQKTVSDQAGGEAVAVLSLDNANHTPPDGIVTELTYFAQRGGGGGTPLCENVSGLTIEMLFDEIDIPVYDIDGSSCGWQPNEMVTVTLSLPAQEMPLVQVKPADETGKAAIFYATSLRDTAGLYEIAVTGASGSVTTTVQATRVQGAGASILHKRDQLFLYGFTPHEQVNLYIYRYEGSEGTFAGWMPLQADAMGELTVQLEGELQQSELVEEEFLYDYVAVGEESGQVSTGWTAVNVIHPDQAQSLVVLPLKQETYYLQAAPCQRCAKMKLLQPGDQLRPIPHPTLGVTHLQNLPHSSNVWWYVQAADGTEGWIHDSYTRLHRRLQPPDFDGRSPGAAVVPLATPAPDWIGRPAPNDVYTDLWQSFYDSHYVDHACQPEMPFGTSIFFSVDVSAEPGTVLQVRTCGWKTGRISTTLTYPPGGLFATESREAVVFGGGAWTSFSTEMDDPAGEYRVVLQGEDGTTEETTQLHPVDGPRFRFAPFEDLGLLLLYGFQPREQVRVFAYELAEGDPPSYLLAGWQAFQTNEEGTIGIMLRDQETEYRIVVVGDVSGEVHGLQPGFGIVPPPVPFVRARTDRASVPLYWFPREYEEESASVRGGTILELLGDSVLNAGKRWWPVSSDGQTYAWIADESLQR